MIILTNDHFKHLFSFAILNASAMYFFFLLDETEVHLRLMQYKISKITILLLIFISISIFVVESGKIPLINQQILSALNKVPLEERLVGNRLCLISEIHQGIYLTIGGSMPITQNLFLVLFGTTLSYSLLIQTFFQINKTP